MWASLALMAEALALREACFLLKETLIYDARIFSDCKPLVQLVLSSRDPPCEISAIVNDIRHIYNSFNIVCGYVPRSENRISHWVVKSTISGTLPLNWVYSPPKLEKL